MQVKKFEAPTIAEALKLVKTELGPEAIILSTKNHRKGFGLLSKASVEVTAAVADKSLVKKQITEKLVPPSTREQIGKLPASKQAAIFDEFNDYVDRKRVERSKDSDKGVRRAGIRDFGSAAYESTQATGMVDRAREQYNERTRESYYGERSSSPKGQAPQRAQGQPPGPARYIDITDDDETQTRPKGYGRNGRIQAQQAAANADAQAERIAEQAPTRAQVVARTQTAASPQTQDAEHMSALQADIERLKTMLEELKSEQIALNDAKAPESSSDELQVEFQNLLRNGIDKRYAAALIKQVSFTLPRESLKNSEKIVEALAVELMNGLKIDHPLDFKSGMGPKVFAFIGPTGVGKTTTIAKLASQAILQRNLRVGLINVDSYKVAALDQLATYAKILNVPFRSASNAHELDRALTEFKPLDLVLIDTTGRSQRDSESLTQMKTLLSENAAVRPVLIMSATTRDQELYDIVTRFKIFNPTGLVFSKLDESSTFGCIYNIAMKTGLPLGYFAVGQRVPEDIEPASRERVADLILDL